MTLGSRLKACVLIVCTVCLAAVVLAQRSEPPGDRDATLASVLERAGAYVADYQRQLTGDGSYETDPRSGLLVPGAMREGYASRTTQVRGSATYGGFRRFNQKDRE